MAHVTGEVNFPSRDRYGHVKCGWAAAQVATSADFAHGSWFWTHFSGGLNYQVMPQWAQDWAGMASKGLGVSKGLQ